MGSVFHVSEEPGITVFAPRPGDVVWAISEARLGNYLLPRDCPRVTFYALTTTTAVDRARFLGDAPAVVAIESVWLSRCESTPLTLYEFDAQPFQMKDAIAGYYTTHETVYPVATRCVERPLQVLRGRGVDVRVLDCLWQLREDVATSSLGFSIIRMRNAAPPPFDFRSRFPVPGVTPGEA
jgi:hypothetical protein